MILLRAIVIGFLTIGWSLELGVGPIPSVIAAVALWAIVEASWLVEEVVQR